MTSINRSIKRIMKLLREYKLTNDHEYQQKIIKDIEHECDDALDDELKQSFKISRVVYELRTLAKAWEGWHISDAISDIANKLENAMSERAFNIISYVEESGGIDVVSDKIYFANTIANIVDNEIVCNADETTTLDDIEYELRHRFVSYDDVKVIEWVREHGGLNSVSASFDWHTLTTERLYRMAFPEEDDCEFVAVDDCFAELDRRLMPPGMEWPRFEDGGFVCFGDMAELDSKVAKVCGVFISKHGFTLWGESGEDTGADARFDYPSGGRVKRPKPAPVGDDGLSIEKDETVYLVDGDGTPLTVVETPIEGCYQSVVVRLPDGNTIGFDPQRLTHTKPESTDSWEQLEKDIAEGFMSMEETDVNLCDEAHDIVLRAKALAER